MSTSLPSGEEKRLQALAGLAILDTLPEAAFDDLALLASTLLETPMALVSLVDRERQWFKAAVGIDVKETPRDIAFCAHAIQTHDVFIVPDAQADERFAANPLVTAQPNFRFYAGAPIRTPDGQAVGTLCVLDRIPRTLTPNQVAALRALGRQVEAQLALRVSVAQLEEAARLQRRYDLASARARDAILVLGGAGEILDANDAASAMYGHDRDALRGMRLHDLSARGEQAQVDQRLDEAASGVLFETWQQRADGTVFPVEVSAQRDALEGDALTVAVVRDVTRRRTAEAAVRLSERVMAATQDAIVIADARAPDMPITYMNAAFERMTGYGSEEVIGRNCRFLQGSERDQPALRDIRSAIAEQRAVRVVLRNYRRDGTLIWIELSLSPIHDEAGVLTNYVGVQTDITRRIEAEADRTALAELRERQKGHLEKELARLADQLVRADRLATLGTLAGGVGHELNNITTVLASYLSFVRESTERGMPAEADDLVALERATEHVKLHGAHLLQLGRPGPDRAERLDLRDIVAATVEMLRNVKRTRQAQVVLEAPPTPVPVTVNRTRIEQVVVNLVGNAVDALAGIVGRPQLVRIVIEVEPEGLPGRVRCAIIDNGAGIPADRIEQVFEPYFTTKAPGHGTGLGLPVVRQIVESYGGTLRLESAEGAGTTFTFDLPIERG